MNKIILWIKNNYLFFIPLFLILIFIFSIRDRNFYIGGDIVLPLNPHNNIYKSIFLWEEENKGVSVWRYTLLLWQIPFYLLSLLGIPPDIEIKFFIVAILIICFVSTYLFYVTVFKNTKYGGKNLGIFCGILFTLSASQINVLTGTMYLAALPLGGYLMIKYLDTTKIQYVLFFSLTIAHAYLAQLPQAKFLFIFLIHLFFVFLIYKYVRNISIKNLFIRIFPLIIVSFFLNAFTLIPFIFDSFKSGGAYSYYSQNFTSYNGEADLRSASLPFISRFFNFNLVNETSHTGRFLASRLFTIWTFFLWIFALLPLFIVKSKKEKKIYYLLLFALISFIFLAKGANPPFGEIYKYLLSHVFLFKVFRTTALAAIGGTSFFAVLVTLSLYHLIKRWPVFLYIILFTHIIIFRPIYLGYTLIASEENGNIQKGYSIPDEYYKMGKILDGFSEDVKILSLPIDETYSYKDWKYSGMSIMNWITKKPFIHSQVAGYSGFKDNLILQRMNAQEACFWTGINNIGYILNEKDSRIPYSLSQFTFPSKSIFENTYFRLDKIQKECQLPHVYIAGNKFTFIGQNNSISDAARFIHDNKDIIIRFDTSSTNDKFQNALSNIVIEAYPNETKSMRWLTQISPYIQDDLSKDISSRPALSDWTYSFVVPQSGSYQIYVDDKELKKVGTRTFNSGNNLLTIPVTRDNSIINVEDLLASQPKSFLQILHGWEKDSIYLLSFTYTVETTSNLSIGIDEISRSYNGRLTPNDLNSTLLLKEINLPGPGEYTYQVLLKSDINAQSAKVTLNQHEGEIKINELTLENVTPPKVFLTSLQPQMIDSPIINVKKINPTKYIINTSHRAEPYDLVLSETFHKGWRAYIMDCEKSCGLITQWLAKPVPEEQHYSVNGYANAWHISPSDSGGKEKYTIIIEYWPQRLFYIGVIISAITLILLFIIHLYSSFRKRN